MLDDLKKSLNKAQDRLDDVADKLEDAMEDVSEETLELWHKTKPKLREMKLSLSNAADDLHTQTDEARLRAHLATMDAHDQWQHLSHTLGDLSRHAVERGAYHLQHADLQAHLARMEARDFMASKGPEIRHDFEQARDKVEERSRHAAQELEQSLEKLGDIWARTGK